MATATYRRRTDEERETPEAKLARIQAGQFGNNDALVITAFAEAGIDPEEIDPRRNVLTFDAWKALDRHVAKGATSVRVTVWIPGKEKEGGGRSMYPTTARLFHVVYGGVTLAKNSIWGLEVDFPAKTGINNDHLLGCANEMLHDTIDEAIGFAEKIGQAAGELRHQIAFDRLANVPH